jgi:hypothetical protein
MDNIILILFSWAIHLSGYAPAPVPDIQFHPHAFFVENVCEGRECEAIGWYDDTGVVYIDERHSNFENSFNASLLVHEFTHYLQHQSGDFPDDCYGFIAREREAYNVQNRFIVEGLGSAAVIFPGPIICQK